MGKNPLRSVPPKGVRFLRVSLLFVFEYPTINGYASYVLPVDMPDCVKRFNLHKSAIGVIFNYICFAKGVKK